MSDLRKLGGILTMEDLAQYRARWEEPVSVHLESLGATLYSVPPPGSGAVLAFILNILDNFSIKPGDDIPLLFHRTVEAFKWAFAIRTELGDPEGDLEIRENVQSVVATSLTEQAAAQSFGNISGDKTGRANVITEYSLHYHQIYFSSRYNRSRQICFLTTIVTHQFTCRVQRHI